MSKLGGPNTARRKIMIRHYTNSQIYTPNSYSSPFISSDSDDENMTIDIKPKGLKNKSSSMELYGNHFGAMFLNDEILGRKVNLDEADKFIASLRLNSRMIREVGKTPKPERKATIIFTAPDDVLKFKEETEKLKKMQMEEAVGKSESDEDMEDESELSDSDDYKLPFEE